MGKSAWTIDAARQRVMLGLTADETAEHQSLLNVSAGVSCEEMQARFASLEERHQAALKGAGVEFIPENGGGAGVRLRNPGAQAATIGVALDTLQEKAALASREVGPENEARGGRKASDE